jgi:hypothetical protein
VEAYQFVGGAARRRAYSLYPVRHRSVVPAMDGADGSRPDRCDYSAAPGLPHGLIMCAGPRQGHGVPVIVQQGRAGCRFAMCFAKRILSGWILVFKQIYPSILSGKRLPHSTDQQRTIAAGPCCVALAGEAAQAGPPPCVSRLALAPARCNTKHRNTQQTPAGRFRNLGAWDCGGHDIGLEALELEVIVTCLKTRA